MAEIDNLSIFKSICGHLSERSAVLFLGAGVNHGTANSHGHTFPLGTELARAISKDLLQLDDTPLTLDDASEIARYRLGDKILNDYLYKLFETFQPTNAHLSLVQLPWDCIYTTNYDLLVESASASTKIKSAGLIRSVFSLTKTLTTFADDDILYYKLHGSIDYANAPDGKLILTKEDYRFYELHRRPLFKRLATDLLSKTFIFVGYSFSDPNFRGILDDCRHELGVNQFPLSYAVRRSFTSMEELFWKEKYNIQLVSADAFDFLVTLKDSWLSEARTVTSYEERRQTMFAFADESTRFPKTGDSFYRIVPSECNAASDAKLFFKGAEPSWPDVRDGIPPKRDAYLSLMEGLFADFADPAGPLSTYLVTGHAGTGKTTLIRTAAFEAARDFDQNVFIHIPETPLDARLLVPFVEAASDKRIVVVIHHAADYLLELDAFVDEIRRRKLPVSIILEERKNQWAMRISQSAGLSKRLTPAEFELGSLTEDEIHDILEALSKWKCLGRLEGTPIEHQFEHFLSLAEKELLVALRELTTDGSFDEIIRNEYENIPSDTAKRAYVYVAAIGQISLGLRYEVACRLLGIGSADLRKQVFTPADGVLITGEVSGGTRHTAGFKLSARHPVIASIIFAKAAETDTEKFRVITSLIGSLDPGYPEDRRILEGIVRRKELINTFADLNRRRELFDVLQRVLPNSAFVLQHRSILERDLRNANNAVSFARQAVALERHNPTLANTLGMALEFSARDVQDASRRSILVKEATRIFDDAITRIPHDPFAYVGKINVLRYHTLELERDSQKKAVLNASAVSMLEDAFEVTNESPVIANLLADQRKQVGDLDEAIAMLAIALKNAPENPRVRDLLITYLSDKGNYSEALTVALAGTKHDPNSWRLQRHLARMMRKNGYALPAIKGAYEAAIRHKKGDVPLSVEFGAYLFMNGQTTPANDIFDEVRRLRASTEDKRQIREWWREANSRILVFSGVVKNIRGATAEALAIPENFRAFFWRTETWIAELREDDRIRFQVGFNGMGPTAKILRPDRRRP